MRRTFRSSGMMAEGTRRSGVAPLRSHSVPRAWSDGGAGSAAQPGGSSPGETSRTLRLSGSWRAVAWRSAGAKIRLGVHQKLEGRQRERLGGVDDAQDTVGPVPAGGEAQGASPVEGGVLPPRQAPEAHSGVEPPLQLPQRLEHELRPWLRVQEFDGAAHPRRSSLLRLT